MYRMYGMTQGAMEGGAAMYRMYGMTQGAMEGGAAMYRMYGMSRCHGKIIAPALSSYPTSMWVKTRSDECPWIY